MSDGPGGVETEGEAPVNPYSLLGAVNASSEAVHLGWLLFIALTSYLFLAVAGVTHVDLLLGRDVTLPALQSGIGLTRFFLFAPIVFVLFHLGVMAQFVTLARKAFALDAALRLVEATERRTYPLRLELSNFFFVQAIAGPERNRLVNGLLNGLTWLTLIVLPLVLLLFMQLVFLPFHDVAITSVHRAVLLVDVGLLVLFGVFLARPEPSFAQALWRVFVFRPITAVCATLMVAAVVAFSCLAATVPGERLDQVSRFALGDVSGSLRGFFHRNLHVTDHALIKDRELVPGRPTLYLRGRDLRYARLDRSDLRAADLTGAKLDGASLVGADLAGATLAHATLAGANLDGARLQRADLTGAALQGARLSTAMLQGANLTAAKLQAADLAGAGLQGAILDLASLDAAALQGADLEGASLYRARLPTASLAGATIRAADLREAWLWRTAPPDPGSSELADLDRVRGDAPGQADEAAIDALLKRTNIAAVSNRAGDILIAAAGKLLPERIKTSADQAGWDAVVRVSLQSAIEPRPDEAAARPGALVPAAIVAPGSGDPTASAGPAAAPATSLRASDKKMLLTRHLVALACKPRWADGAVASGLAMRAASPAFNGDSRAIYEGLSRPECAGGRLVPPGVMSRLAAIVDGAGGK